MREFIDLNEKSSEKPVLQLTRVYPNRIKKIEAIENELYLRAMKEDIPTTEMIEIFQVLADVEHQNDSLEIKRENSGTGFLSGLFNVSFTLLAIATIVSLIALKPCERSETPFCKSAKIIPEFIQNIFREPPKSKVSPVNLP